MIYLLASTAEVSRIPFDLPEAEGELVAGYHTEYGGMRWAMFQNAEYVATIAFSALASILFLGGYDGPCAAGAGVDAAEDGVLHLHHDLDPLDAAPRALRPADDDRLEGAAARSATLNLIVTAASGWVD